MKIVNEAEFDEIIKQGITLVDFYADWCGPCKMLSPILEELDSEYSNVRFVKVNCDNDIHLAEKYGIMSIPAIYMFKDGNILANTGGYRPKVDMKKFIDDSLNK